jgi:hypothetical protein
MEPYKIDTASGWSIDMPHLNQIGYRASEFNHEAYTGLTHDRVELSDEFHAQSLLYQSSSITEPESCLFSQSTIATLTAMLWPASGDFEKVGVTPLVDIAEMASDMVFPLGPPPSAVDAHRRMTKYAIDDNVLFSLRESIDFAANSWLWTTLVLEPVISSAVGLMTAVEANDKAIDAYTKQAKSGKWQQGKSLRIFGQNTAKVADQYGLTNPDPIHPSLPFYSIDGVDGVFSHEIDVKKMEGNASFNYKLSDVDAALMNTSGMRIGQFFNRLSVSLDTVFHNIIPLSFVYDWFSSDYTGILNLKDKVYVSVADWNLVVSYKLDMDIEAKSSLSYTETTFQRKWCEQLITIDWTTFQTVYIERCHPVSPITYLGIYASKPNENLGGGRYMVYFDPSYNTYSTDDSSVETHKFYRRNVYNRPTRRTDFSNGEIGIDCLDTTKYDPLEEVGKQVTLGALLWGFTK